MEPNFIRPAMTSYLANRRPEAAPSETDRRLPARTPVMPRARRAIGALLIALGHRLAGTPRAAFE
jgi:hypothetical protein